MRKGIVTETDETRALNRVFGLTLEQCWHTVCQHCSREVLARANSTPGQVLAQSVLTAGSRGVRTHWRQVSANMTSKIAHILLKIARIFLLASARRRTRVPTVCQQRRWQVLEHCANSRIRAGVGTKSVLTVHLSVLTLDRRPWTLDPPADHRPSPPTYTRYTCLP